VLTKKIKNKKYIVTSWESNNDCCLAVANDCFRMNGYNPMISDFKVDTLNYVKTEKMYNGYADDHTILHNTIAEVEKWNDLKHIDFLKKHYTINEILLNHPEYSIYLTDKES
jgi:hypothetical protein